MEMTLKDNYVKETWKILELEVPKYAVLEVSPSKLTSNTTVKWLITEFSRLHMPMTQRIKFTSGKIVISPEMDVWWEVFLHKGQIHFYLIVPDKEDIKDSMKRQLMKTWKQANVREVTDYMPSFSIETTDLLKLELEQNSILALDTNNPQYSPLDSFLNAKHYLKDDDMALLQIGMRPLGNQWNVQAKSDYAYIKKNKQVPRKKGKAFNKKEIFKSVAYVIGLVAEECINLIGDFLIPGWQEDRTIAESMKEYHGTVDSVSTAKKVSDDAFRTDIRIVSSSENPDRRASIIRAISSGFAPLEGDNKLVEIEVSDKKKQKELDRVSKRRLAFKMSSSVFGAIELSKMINVPDQKAQIEHYNELSLVTHRGETDVPKEIFNGTDKCIPFALYQDTDGEEKTVYFTGANMNLLCMPRVVIGEPGTGKTTFAQNFALDAFYRGYGVFMIDAADGKMVQRILDRIKPEFRDKVKIIDYTNTENPIGLGWNEIFRSGNLDVVEDLIVEEVISYVEMISGTDLNMRARQWVEASIKATFTTPDATLQDVENMLNNAEYRNRVIPTITDPELRTDWEYYHNTLNAEARKTIYDEAFRRLAPVMRKKTLKNFILQKPKKDSEGNYLYDIRKWMDEGYLVLVKANETLGETIQTAVVSFTLAKFNLAMISREDIVNEDDRRPCFLLLDEPDHYIRGSEKWRNMLTRYRKYRCGLIFMFHGWQQLVEADKNLPKIIRKAGPHYIIFQTDEDNLLELKSVIEPDFKVKDIAKGMAQWHAVIRLKMHSESGEVIPAFMAKSIGQTEKRFDKYNNDDLYTSCSLELGRPKQEVMDEIYKTRRGSEFSLQDDSVVFSMSGEGKLESSSVEEDNLTAYKKEVANRRLEYEVGEYLSEMMERGEEPDYELLEHMDELLKEG